MVPSVHAPQRIKGGIKLYHRSVVWTCKQLSDTKAVKWGLLQGVTVCCHQTLTAQSVVLFIACITLCWTNNGSM